MNRREISCGDVDNVVPLALLCAYCSVFYKDVTILYLHINKTLYRQLPMPVVIIKYDYVK